MIGISWLKSKKRTVGLALGGGAVWCAAQIGFLEVLEENGIKPDAIAGTSAGSIVASLYAFGIPLHEIKKRALEIKLSDVFHWKLSKLGFSQTDRIKEYIKDAIGEKSIEEANIPLFITATNLLKSEPYVFTGDFPVHIAVAASCAIPGIFVPEQIDNEMFVDGSLMSDVNCKVLKDNGINTVIGVEMCDCRFKQKPTNMFEVILISLQSMIEKGNNEMEQFADFMVRIDVSGIGRFDTDKIPFLFQKGRDSAFSILSEILNKI